VRPASTSRKKGTLVISDFRAGGCLSSVGLGAKRGCEKGSIAVFPPLGTRGREKMCKKATLMFQKKKGESSRLQVLGEVKDMGGEGHGIRTKKGSFTTSLLQRGRPKGL